VQIHGVGIPNPFARRSATPFAHLFALPNVVFHVNAFERYPFFPEFSAGSVSLCEIKFIAMVISPTSCGDNST